MFGYKPNGEPHCLWSFIVRDSALDMTTEVKGGRVCIQYYTILQKIMQYYTRLYIHYIYIIENLYMYMYNCKTAPSVLPSMYTILYMYTVYPYMYICYKIAQVFALQNVFGLASYNCCIHNVLLYCICACFNVLVLFVVNSLQVQRVIASLANGTLCIFYRKSITPNLPSQLGDATVSADACQLKCENQEFYDEAKDWDNPYILTLSEGIRAAAVKCMTAVGSDQLWCGCGNTISVVDIVNLKVLNNFSVFHRRNQHINELVSNGVKVWGIGRQLSCVMEWDAKTQDLLTIFDCSRIDPTSLCLKGDPNSIEELTSTTTNPVVDEITPSQSPATDNDSGSGNDNDSSSLTSASPLESEFRVENEPQNPSRTSNAPFNASLTRRTLKSTHKPLRSRAINMSIDTRKGIFVPIPDMDAQRRARIRSHLRIQGATRTTSLLYVKDVLWVARGMGDVLIIDVSETDNHGVVLARFASEDSHKYGNRSTHKLCQVGSHSVVSSQWLEPLDLQGPITSKRPSLPTEGTISSEPLLTAHQQITVWDAWDKTQVQMYNHKIGYMLQLDKQGQQD